MTDIIYSLIKDYFHNQFIIVCNCYADINGILWIITITEHGNIRNFTFSPPATLSHQKYAAFIRMCLETWNTHEIQKFNH